MEKNKIKAKRLRVRSKIKKDRARLTVYKSNKYIYGQILDAVGGKVIATSTSRGQEKKANKVDGAQAAGIELAKKAVKKKIKKVAFDRGSYKYHGRVKAFAEGARKGGLEF